jgi:hypothetical protein
MLTKCRPNSRTRARVQLALALCFTIAPIGGAVFQRGGAQVAAQSGSPPSGQQCAPADTQQTTICHVPPGRPEQAQTSCVANSAVAAHLANHPEDCVGSCPCAQPVAYSTCAPVQVTQLHGAEFLGNARLARIEDGKVACLHVETGALGTCLFNADSGEWVEATDGSYARMGQAITPQGEPGGEWAVAARVSDQGTVPCVPASGNDSAGVATGMELAIACVIETTGSASNASGLPLLHYATLDVCTSSSPHPDTHLSADGTEHVPVLVTTIGELGETSYCYTGEGAALNDRYGTERDANGVYYPGSDYCHVVRSSGYEVYGAKRPSTYVGQVLIHTPILWRSVINNVAIANE